MKSISLESVELTTLRVRLCKALGIRSDKGTPSDDELIELIESSIRAPGAWMIKVRYNDDPETDREICIAKHDSPTLLEAVTFVQEESVPSPWAIIGVRSV